MNTIDEDGYELWLRYRPVDNAERLAQYRKAISRVVVPGTSATAEIIRSELARALPALLGSPVPLSEKPVGNALVVARLTNSKPLE
jgi:alpha-glucuronidase